MNAIVDVGYWSEPGNRHPQSPGNQDDGKYIVSEPGSPEPPLYDFVGAVADGVSQSPGGADAARAAVRAALKGLAEQYEAKCDRILQEKDAYPGFDDLIIKAFHAAHDAVRRQAPDGRAVLALACLQGDRLMAGSLGDARVYLFRDGHLRLLTRDDRGEVGVTALLGGGSPSDPRIVAEPLVDGDVVLLCSDGLWETVHPALLEQTLGRAAQLSARDLALQIRKAWERARDASFDDATLMAVTVNRVGKPFWAAPPAPAGRPTEYRERGPRPRPAALPPDNPAAPAARTAPQPAADAGDPAIALLAERVGRLTEQLAGARLLLFADQEGRGPESPERQAHRALVDYLVRRLEGDRISDEEMDALMPGRKRGWLAGWSAPALVVLILGLLLLGVAAGWGGSTWLAAARARGKPAAAKPHELRPRYPADFGQLVSQEARDGVFTVTYLTRSKGGAVTRQKRIAVYPLDGDGFPSAIITPPTPRAVEPPAPSVTEGTPRRPRR